MTFIDSFVFSKFNHILFVRVVRVQLLIKERMRLCVCTVSIVFERVFFLLRLNYYFFSEIKPDTHRVHKIFIFFRLLGRFGRLLKASKR